MLIQSGWYLIGTVVLEGNWFRDPLLRYQNLRMLKFLTVDPVGLWPSVSIDSAYRRSTVFWGERGKEKRGHFGDSPSDGLVLFI